MDNVLWESDALATFQRLKRNLKSQKVKKGTEIANGVIAGLEFMAGWERWEPGIPGEEPTPGSPGEPHSCFSHSLENPGECSTIPARASLRDLQPDADKRKRFCSSKK
ncbi:hypothetical protein Y1Q_0014261 [Alligator mississippiensis]|uniref:Uncharacterized protein n=1 Tax=Alligator mississippiensis TaxID=8496 RepID=A0A151LZH1_ALLMI|nr:hypothetical protein Y1Q_0014261 [Alligator mississippiensis]